MGWKLILGSLSSWLIFCTLSKAWPSGHLGYKDISDGPCRTIQDGHQRSMIFLLLSAPISMHISTPSISSKSLLFGIFSLPGAEMIQNKWSAGLIFPRHAPWNCSHFFFQYSGLNRPNYLCFGFPFNHYSNGCNSACLMFSLESTLHQWLFFQSCVLLNVLSALSLSALL